jgi:hypothetical protein
VKILHRDHEEADRHKKDPQDSPSGKNFANH